ncbi:MAG TPA: hypothetical protein DCZ75_19625 [Geobacter sp.]|nr:hypothetical protein [Geobacter sp.]
MKCLWRFDEKGQVFILLALLITVLVAFAGLAVDVGMAYVVKTKLNAAVDAAALAAGRVVGADDGSATTEADKFFHANYPDQLLGATVQQLSVDPQYDDKTKSWMVTVSTKATVPTYFARAAGWPALTVQATATSTINPVDLVLVMDSTRSLSTHTSEKGTSDKLRNAAKNFVGVFNPKNDRVGLIRFACGAVQDVKITSARGFQRKWLDAGLDLITEANAKGFTTAEEALRLAKKQLDDVPSDQQSPNRIIVFFTDGAPNGVAANFVTATGNQVGTLSSEPTDLTRLFDVDGLQHPLNVRATGDIPDYDWTGTISAYSYNNVRHFNSPTGTPIALTRENINRAARSMLENIVNDARSEAGTPITVFTIGLGTLLTTQEGLEDGKNYDYGYGKEELGENILKRIANTRDADTYNLKQPTGVYAWAQNASELDAAFGQVARAILRLSR